MHASHADRPCVVTRLPTALWFHVVSAAELYDHGADTGADMDFLVTNVVDDPANAGVVAAMARIIREGWKQQRPSGHP